MNSHCIAAYTSTGDCSQVQYSGPFDPNHYAVAKTRQQHRALQYICEAQNEAVLMARLDRHEHIAANITVHVNCISGLQTIHLLDCSLANLYMSDDQLAGDEPRKRLYSVHLMRAVAYCHQQGIAHRNICASNVFVDVSRLCLKLTSFDSACPLNSVFDANVGALNMQAPETLIGGLTVHLAPLDVWAAALVLAELWLQTELISEPAFFYENEDIAQHMLTKIFTVTGTPTQDTWSELPAGALANFAHADGLCDELFSGYQLEMQQFFAQALQCNPQKRATSRNLLELIEYRLLFK